LESDRWSYLAVRAYSKGLLTFKAIDRRDDRWKLREELILSELERDILLGIHRMLHAEDVAAAQYIAGNDVFRYYHERAKKQYASVASLEQPYDKRDYQFSDEKSTIDRMIDVWKQEFGDPDDIPDDYKIPVPEEDH